MNKTTTALVSVGILIGTAAVIGLQTHAQQITSAVPQVQNQVAATPAQPAADKATPQDTDNIQDPGGIEKPDTQGIITQVKGDTETKDDQGSDKDTAPDNGKDDQNGSNTSSSDVTK